MTQPAFIQGLHDAFKTEDCKPKVVEVVDCMWDYKKWWLQHVDSHVAGITDYKCFRFKRAQSSEHTRGWIAVMHVKVFMTSVKSSYFPRSTSLLPASRSGTAVDELLARLRSWCLEEGLSDAQTQAMSAAAAPATSIGGPPVEPSPKVMAECRMLLDLPAVETLTVAPFKQLSVDGNRRLVVERFFSGGKTGKDRAQYHNEFALQGKVRAPTDMQQLSGISSESIEKTRPDAVNFMAELALWQFKVAMMVTVRLVTVDPDVVAWWKEYLTAMSGYAPAVAATVDTNIFYPPGYTGPCPAPANTGGGVDDVAPTDDAAPAARTAFVEAHSSHRKDETRQTPDLSYDGYRKSVRDNARRLEHQTTANRRQRHNRLKAEAPALKKGSFAWVAVTKGADDKDKCVFDVALIKETHDKGVDRATLVLVTWLYRLHPSIYDSSFFKGKRRTGDGINKSVTDRVPRISIEVENLVMQKPAPRSNMYKLTRSDKQLVADADIGFSFNPKEGTGRGHVFMYIAPSHLETEEFVPPPLHNDTDAAEDQPALLEAEKLWRGRFRNWPCVEEPAPTEVYGLMNGRTRDVFVNNVLKSNNWHQRISIAKNAASVGFSVVPSLELSQAVTRILRLGAWNDAASGTWEGSERSRAERYLPIAPRQHDDDHIMDGADEFSNLCLDVDYGRDFGSNDALSGHLSGGELNRIASDATFLPWGSTLQDVAGLCGMFQEAGCDHNPWFFVKLRFTWVAGESTAQQRRLGEKVPLSLQGGGGGHHLPPPRSW
jgi:hypothetical protein